jgi:hypothetical protein
MYNKRIQKQEGKPKSAFFPRFKSPGRPSRIAALVTASLLVTYSIPVFITQAHANTFERLSSLLADTPAGGWVQANVNVFSDAWPTGFDAVQIESHKFPGAIVSAWSSFAWDSANARLILWGGGHANYSGNEVYIWDGATGNWGRGSLPSRVDANGFVVDAAAPQSAHTYDNNIYLPVNGMFLTFGGAAAPGGGNFQETDGTTVSRAGPYIWDPLKADPMKVGGTTGSGWNTINVAQGGQMWMDREGQWSGVEPGQYVNGTAAYRTENGHDVVYLTAEGGSASGFPSLYRYTLGDIRNGGTDTWERIGVMNNSVGFQGTGTIDTDHNLYIKTATVIGPYTSDLTIWDLSKANATNPNFNQDIGINLVNSDGSDFVIDGNYGIDYDPVNKTIVLWDGRNGGGDVWWANVATDPNGNIETTWVIHKVESSTLAHPHGSFLTGVLGKWHYDSTLHAFIALDETSRVGATSWDAGVWLYKPAMVIPEPETYALFLAGLGLIGWAVRRQQR